MTRIAKDADIATQGIEALARSLGPARTHRFLTLLRPRPTNYVRVSRQIYSKQSVDEIFARSLKRTGSGEDRSSRAQPASHPSDG